MQYLAVFLLVGLGFASAYTSDFDGGLSIDGFENVDQTPLQVGGWISDQMRKTLERMVEGFEKALKEGKKISEDSFRKAEEMYHKLLDWGIDVGEKVKEALERIGKDFEDNRPDQDEYPMQVGGWISDQMRKTLERMVEGFEKALEEGKKISEDSFRKAEEMYHKLLDWGIDVGEKVKEALERIGKDFEKNNEQLGPVMDRLKESFERIVNKMKERFDGGGGIDGGLMKKAQDLFDKLKSKKFPLSDKIKSIFEDLKSKMGRSSVQSGSVTNRLKEAFENLVNKIKERVDGGSGVSSDLMKRAEDIYEKLKNLKVEISEKIRNIFEDLRSKFGKNSVQQGPIIDKLKEAFERIVSRIKERFDGGSGVSGGLMGRAENIYEILKNLRVEISEKIRSIFEDMRSKMGRNSVQSGPMTDRMKEAFENIVNRIKEAFDSGKGVRGDLMKKAEDIYEKLKNLNVEISDKIKSIFEDLRSKMGRNSVQSGPMGDRLKEAFENIVNRIKEAFDSGKGVRGDLMKKAEDIFEKLKNMKVEISDKIKSIFEDLRTKMGRNGPTSQDASISNIFDLFRRLKQLIKEKLDSEKLKEKVEELFGRGSEIAEQIVEMLRTKGEKAKQKILDWIDRILPDKEERSISEVYDKLREFFKDLQLDLKERFTKFGEWVKEQYEKGLEKGKTRAENIKKIAKEFIDDTRVIGKDMAEEALGFFREYKKDLGKLYDNVVDKIGKILKS